MRVSMPKFVITVAFIAANLSACSLPNEQSATPSDGETSSLRASQATGLQTKTGKAITVTEMCAAPAVDASGKTTIATLRFYKSSQFVRRTRAMTDKSLFVIEQEAKGTWSLFGDKLLITESGKTVQNDIEVFTRESDGASCLRFASDENRPEYCACGFN